jgi:hypothetical protein
MWFVIPKWLKRRWHLTIGRSQDALLPLLTKLGSIDIFLHDSEHSYENLRESHENLRHQDLNLRREVESLQRAEEETKEERR